MLYTSTQNLLSPLLKAGPTALIYILDPDYNLYLKKIEIVLNHFDIFSQIKIQFEIFCVTLCTPYPIIRIKPTQYLQIKRIHNTKHKPN